MTPTAPIISTRAGTVRGATDAAGVSRFRGIPFAAEPIGERRFMPPAPAAPWSGVRDATTFGPQAPQVAGGIEAMFGGKAETDEATCLTLNITAPPGALEPGATLRPVLVWIHGGGYLTGSGSTPWYEGSKLATRGDAIVVTINYRLGVLGFCDFESLGGAWAATGAVNVGMLDQIAALDWVRTNIGAFGGDPGRVTIFGESAGGGSVVTLLAMPAAAGLFQRAIAQSPCVDEVKARPAAADLAAAVLAHLGLASDAGPEALAAVPVEMLLEAQASLASRSGSALGLPFCPVFGTPSLPQHPRYAIEGRDGVGGAATAHDVPLLIGTNADEIRLFQLMANGAFDKRDDLHAAKVIAIQTGGSPADAEALIAAYRAGRPDAEATELFVDSQTDLTFRIPSIEIAAARADRGAPTWMYRFDWQTPAFGGSLGACHALEIPFVFDNLDQRGVSMFVGDGDAPGRQAIADEMSAAWLAFATSQDPATGPGWPAYDTTTRATQVFDAASSLVGDPAGDVRTAWEPLRRGS